MPRPRTAGAGGRRRLLHIVVCVLSAAVAACADPGVQPLAPNGPPPSSLGDLPDCQGQPEAAGDLPADLVQDWPLPSASRVLRVDRSEARLVTGSGWAPMTAGAFRAAYDEPPTGWEVVVVENELTEAEVLLARGEERFFVQAVARCSDEVDLYMRVVATPTTSSD